MAESTGDVGGIVENMLKVRANNQAGGSYQALLAEAGVLPEMAGPPEQPVEPTYAYVADAGAQIIAARPAELAAPYMDPRGVGLTERGWSSEVTSRHPSLVADTMAELAAEAGGAAPEPIDPTDPAALAQAQTELGFADVRANNLRVGAINRNSERLTEALSAVSNATAAARAALAGAVENAQAALRQAAPPPSTPPPPPPPPPHRRSSESGAS